MLRRIKERAYAQKALLIRNRNHKGFTSVRTVFYKPFLAYHLDCWSVLTLCFVNLIIRSELTRRLARNNYFCRCLISRRAAAAASSGYHTSYQSFLGAKGIVSPVLGPPLLHDNKYSDYHATVGSLSGEEQEDKAGKRACPVSAVGGEAD